MKKIIALLLTSIMVLTLLVSCGDNGKTPDNTKTYDVVEVMNNALEKMPEDFLFPAFGGSFEESTENAAGEWKMDNTDDQKAAFEQYIGVDATSYGKISKCATLYHMMNMNTFTAGAVCVDKAEDIQAVVNQIKENVLGKQWVCGFPDVLVITTVGNVVVVNFGNQELVEKYRDSIKAAYEDAVVAVEETISAGNDDFWALG